MSLFEKREDKMMKVIEGLIESDHLANTIFGKLNDTVKIIDIRLSDIERRVAALETNRRNGK